MDYVCKGNSLFQVFCKELHCICNLVFEGLRSMSPILEIKPVKWLRPVLGWKWLREFRYVNSCIKPSSLFLSADVNGEILFVPCCWKYFLRFSTSSYNKVVTYTECVTGICLYSLIRSQRLPLPLLLSFGNGVLPALPVSPVWHVLLSTKTFLGRITLQSCSDLHLVIFPFWHLLRALNGL